MLIFSYLAPKNLSILCTVCKRWSQYLSLQPAGIMDTLWRDLFYWDFMQRDTPIIDSLGPSAVKVTASSIWTGSPEGFIGRGDAYCWTKNQLFAWYFFLPKSTN